MLYDKENQENHFYIMLVAMIFLPILNLLILILFLSARPQDIHSNTKWKVFLMYLVYYGLIFLSAHFTKIPFSGE